MNNQNFVPSTPRMSSNRRELIINVSFLIIANILIKPYYIFFVERKIQNEVGTAAWGIYFTLFSLSMLPQIILDMGLTSFVNQKLSGHREQLNIIWKDTIWVKPILAIIFGIAFLMIAWIGGYMKDFSSIIWWIMINQVLLSGILFLRAFVSGLGFYRWDSVISIADKFIFIILFTFGILFFKIPSIQHFLWIQTLSLSIPFLIVLAWLSLSHGIRNNSFSDQEPVMKLKEFYIKSKRIIRESLPYAGIFILMVLFCRMEPVWIDILRSDGAIQSGVYAAAYRLLDAANMMGFLFAGILLPMFSHAIGKGDHQEYQSIFDLAGRIMIPLSVLIGITIMNQHRVIMSLLYKDVYPDILNIVIINLVPLTINYLLSTLLTAAGKAKVMNQYFLISIGINVCSHILLTARYGARGAAYTALITQIATVFLLSHLVYKFRLIRFSMKHLINLAGSIITVFIITKLIDLIPGIPVLKWIIMMVSSLILLIGLNILPFRSIIELLRQKRY
jgi:O-antigen/teichoic acid export membrane protein